MLCANNMKVMYRLDGLLCITSFDDLEYDESTSTLTFSSMLYSDMIVTIPRASAIIAMSKLLADGYCDLQSFDCRFED